ncbi:MAG: hypothetical protein Q8Q00_00580 [Dehalococcoidia bacterium]|nr:hypothetical protein [Dehalococcoidia bacterium]
MSFQTTSLQSVSGWLGRLARLDLTVFEEVRSDPSATPGAIVVVFLASVLAGIGSWLWAVQTNGVSADEVFVKSLVIGSILQTLAWFIWVYLVFQVLARAYGARTDFYELIRTMGFAFAPVAMSVLVAITAFAVPFGVAALAGATLFSHFAIESSSSAEPRQILIANFVGFLSFAVVMGVLANIAEINTVGGLAPGLFFFSLDLR